jgi:putative spermidine/putrescine transport system permease protein
VTGRQVRTFHLLLVLPALLFLGAFVLVPLGYLLSFSLHAVNAQMVMLRGFSLSQYVEAFTSPIYLHALGMTLWVALLTTAICVVLAYPAAYLVTRATSPALRAVLYVALLSPLLISVVVRTFGWMVLLENDGLINQLLMALHLVSQPVQLLWNLNAVLIAYVNVLLPFAVLPLITAFSGIDPTLRRASMSLGGTRWTTFWRVSFPLTIPGLLSGAMLTFSLAAGSYITPLMVGGGTVPLLPVDIYQQALQVFDLPLAAALSLVLLSVVLVVVAVLAGINQRWEARVRG